MRTRNFNEPLPWLVTSPGVNQEFLLREWHHAMNASLTEDCRRGRCTACGICPNLGVHVIDYKKQEDARLAQEDQEAQSEQEKGADAAKQESEQSHDPKGPGRPRTLYAWRSEITKGEELRYVSHLDYANLFLRAFDRAKLPMAYSEGFNPHMKVAFASALARRHERLGVHGLRAHEALMPARNLRPPAEGTAAGRQALEASRDSRQAQGPDVGGRRGHLHLARAVCWHRGAGKGEHRRLQQGRGGRLAPRDAEEDARHRDEAVHEEAGGLPHGRCRFRIFSQAS